jgi:uncharacterized protein
MSLMQQLDQDLKQAMIAKDELRLSTIRFLKSAVKYVAIDKGSDIVDADILQVIQKQIKQRKESIQQFVDNGRKELAAKEEAEIKVLEGYLPKQMSDADLNQLVENEVRAQNASGKKDFGRMMKHLGEKLAGSADNKRLSEILGKLLK